MKTIQVVASIIHQNGKILATQRGYGEYKGLWEFPGGKMEPGETEEQAIIREIREETGLTIENPTLCGTKQFPTRNGERYVVFFYKTNRFSGELKSSDEGEVFWIPRNTLNQYTLVDDFEAMVRVFESENVSEFYYYLEDHQWKLKLL